jgi:hypothetical protein
MPEFEIAPVKCRLDKMSADGISGASCHEFCLYELRGCAGCPHADRERRISRSAEDPVKSAVRRGWIRGLAHLRSKQLPDPCDIPKRRNASAIRAE